MERSNSYSLQKIPLRRSIKTQNYSPERLNFPKIGDSSIFNGVGKKYYGGNEQSIKFVMPIAYSAQLSKIKKSSSVRNILSVADIEGTKPSVAPEKVKNVLRAKQSMNKHSETLDQYEKYFSLKNFPSKELISTNNSQKQYNIPDQVLSIKATQRKLNPTFLTSFSLAQ